jgi:isopropylmalate/homocitrate/citramalate synthase
MNLERSRIPRRVRVVEVGPRDGLQNEAAPVATDAKVRYLEMLADAGLTTIEAGSFVRPDRVPQLADSAEVFARLAPRAGVRHVALVPNLKGLERALACGARSVAVFTAASDGFNRANIDMTVAESLEIQRPVVERAKREGLWVRGYVSTGFGCPYDGEVKPEKVRDVVMALAYMGVDEISLGDTIGVATPLQVERLVTLVAERYPLDHLALHFHDTRGTALANVLAGLLAGVGIFDASSGGLGGCPFAPGASGNLATEDLVYMLDGMGVETGVSLAKLAVASRFIGATLGRALPSRYLQSLPA